MRVLRASLLIRYALRYAFVAAATFMRAMRVFRATMTHAFERATRICYAQDMPRYAQNNGRRYICYTIYVDTFHVAIRCLLLRLMSLPIVDTPLFMLHAMPSLLPARLRHFAHVGSSSRCHRLQRHFATCRFDFRHMFIITAIISPRVSSRHALPDAAAPIFTDAATCRCFSHA